MIFYYFVLVHEFGLFHLVLIIEETIDEILDDGKYIILVLRKSLQRSCRYTRYCYTGRNHMSVTMHC